MAALTLDNLHIFPMTEGKRMARVQIDGTFIGWAEGKRNHWKAYESQCHARDYLRNPHRFMDDALSMAENYAAAQELRAAITLYEDRVRAQLPANPPVIEELAS